MPSARICEPVRPGRGLALPPRMPRGCRSPGALPALPGHQTATVQFLCLLLLQRCLGDQGACGPGGGASVRVFLCLHSHLGFFRREGK